MKKLILLLFFLLFSSFYLIKVPSASAVNNCLTITGRFNANNWTEGSIMVGCQGLRQIPNKPVSEQCLGDKAEVRPGRDFTLKNCACPWNSITDKLKKWADGCLYVAKRLDLQPEPDRKNRPGVVVVEAFPEQCTLSSNKFTKVLDFKGNSGLYRSIAENKFCGKNGETKTINFSATCPGPSSTPTPTPTPTSTPTPTPSLSPSPSSCPTPTPVLNVKIKCPNCKEASPTPSPSSAQQL